MGYKLAGFDVLGCNEIDHRMMYAYCQNHNPKYPFLEPIQEFKNREDAWGVEKHFREGQQEQILDTLFFDFIDLAKKLQPKVVIGENVKGMLIGDAIKYVAKIHDAFDEAGYYCQHWLLDGQNMGVPQRRERVFFVCLRKDLAKPFLYQASLFEQQPRLTLEFNEQTILFKEVADYSGREANSKVVRTLWENRQNGDTDQGDANMRLYGKGNSFNQSYVYLDKICPTLASKETCLVHYDKPQYLGKSEVCSISSFPQDYNFAGQSPHYVCGMSVPPLMIAQVATRIWEQWLSKI